MEYNFTQKTKTLKLRDLYRHYKNPHFIFILGCAPCLFKYKKVNKSSSDMVIALNSSFLAFDNDIHFFSDDRFVEEYKNFLFYKKTAIHSNNIGFVGYDKEYVYNPTKDTYCGKSNRLLSGHSVLIPALHFALLLKPTAIFLYGIDMNNMNHWDKEEYAISSFPAAHHICNEIAILCSIFKSPVYCENRNSLVVRKGIIDAIGSSHSQQQRIYG